MGCIEAKHKNYVFFQILIDQIVNLQYVYGYIYPMTLESNLVLIKDFKAIHALINVQLNTDLPTVNLMIFALSSST